MRTDLLDIIDNGPGGLFFKMNILCIIQINCAFPTIDSRAKYGVEDPDADPYSEYGYGSGRII